VGVFGVFAAWTIALVIFIGALSVGLWAFGVFSSDIQGAGNARKQKNAAVTRIGKQEQFEQLAADYNGYLVKITVAKDSVKSAVGEDVSLRQTELTGLRQICIDTAQQFNAESRKYTARDWKSAGLPLTLNPEGCTA
jgi:hypothetical protein